jgi:hypothetical protein
MGYGNLQALIAPRSCILRFTPQLVQVSNKSNQKCLHKRQFGSTSEMWACCPRACEACKEFGSLVLDCETDVTRFL